MIGTVWFSHSSDSLDELLFLLFLLQTLQADSQSGVRKIMLFSLVQELPDTTDFIALLRLSGSMLIHNLVNIEIHNFLCDSSDCVFSYPEIEL